MSHGIIIHLGKKWLIDIFLMYFLFYFFQTITLCCEVKVAKTGEMRRLKKRSHMHVVSFYKIETLGCFFTRAASLFKNQQRGALTC